MGTEAPTVCKKQKCSGHKVPNVFFYPVQPINVMLFILVKQITGIHQQLFECIHVFSSVLSQPSACQCELAPDATCKGQRVCVRVRLCV